MSKRSRDKGAAGEREFFRLARRCLGLKELRRNLSQTQATDADLERALAGYCLEIKRTACWSEDYWRQAMEQAQRRCEVPALAHRQDRNRWLVMVPDASVGLRTASGRVVLEARDWLAMVKAAMIEEVV